MAQEKIKIKLEKTADGYRATGSDAETIYKRLGIYNTLKELDCNTSLIEVADLDRCISKMKEYNVTILV